MKQKLRQLRCYLGVFLLFFIHSYAIAEGTKQWSLSSTDYSFLKVNSTGSYAFAGYGVAANKRLNIHIADPNNEKVFIGLSRFVEENGTTVNDIGTVYQFRIVSPSGSIVHGPFSVSTPNLTSYSMAATGPDSIYAGGYPTSAGGGMWEFDPSGNPAGDYYIEFSTAGSIRWFDITVATQGGSPTAIDGRVWSQAWAVRATDGFGDGEYFDEPFNGTLVAYDGEFATVINFDGSGIRPLEGQFSFNTTGTGNSGNIEADRRSVEGINSTNPEHKIFLNQPDSSVFPLGVEGQLQNLPLIVVDPSSPTIKVEVTQPGTVEIALDFGGAADRRLFADVVTGTNYVAWDGLKGDGSSVGIADYPIPANIRYTQGETHFTAYDVEGLDNGFEVFTQANGSIVGPNLQYWDDANILDSPGGSGASDAQTNVDTGASTRRRWTNSNYGDINTINTWWYAYEDSQTTTIVAAGDYGDAPDTYGDAYHSKPDDTTVYLGTLKPDGEYESLNATNGGDDGTGDESDNIADEDGVNSLPALYTTTTAYTIPASSITTHNASGVDATLYAYIDFNNNGHFNDAGESISVNVSAGATQPDSDLSFTGFTMAAAIGTTYARFRISGDAGLSSTGIASNGEVEDYVLDIADGTYTPPACEVIPAGEPSAALTTAEVSFDIDSVGNSHNLVSVTVVGEPNPFSFLLAPDRVEYSFGTPDAGNQYLRDQGVATGVNITNGPVIFDPALLDANTDRDLRHYFSLDGSIFNTDYVDFLYDTPITSAGNRYVMMTERLGNNRAGVQALDINGNPIAGTAEGIPSSTYIDTGVEADFGQNVNIAIYPLTAIAPSNTPIYGIRHIQTGATGGDGADGKVFILVDPVSVCEDAFDYGDAPISGLAPDGTNNNAYGEVRHMFVSGFSLGNADPDVETGYQASTNADGDNTDGNNDEDGVNIASVTLTQGQTASLTATVVGAGGYLQAWIDFDGNGVFDVAEQVATNYQDGGAGDTDGTAGTITFDVAVPATAIINQTYARFRWSTDQNLDAISDANDGEVEDYALTIEEGVSLDPFQCDGTPYVVIDTPSMLQSVDRDTLAVTDLGNLNPAVRINGIAYNALDNFIYGFFSDDAGAGSGISTYSMVRIGSNRELENLGVPTGSSSFIPLTHIGTMDNGGNFYGIDSSNIYVVDIGSEPAANTLNFTTISRSGSTATPPDITFSVYDDALYGVQGGNLIRIELSGAGSVVATTGDALPSAAGGAWSAADGNLYFYSNQDGTLARVDVTQATPVVYEIGPVTPNGQFDGTACTPPTLKKAASVTQTLAGTRFDYTYTIDNAFNFPILVNFADALPAEVTYDTATLSNAAPGGGSVDVFTSTNLEINSITLPANGQVSFSVTVDVDASIVNTTNVDNQALLSYGVNTFNSDDPTTADIDDATRVVVIPVDYGDAPASYDATNGSAGHGLDADLYIGHAPPDTEIGSQHAANGGADGMGDDNDVNGDDEDGIASFATLTDIDTNYSVDVLVHNSTSQQAHLVGWIDVDLDGVFSADEAATIAVNAGTSGTVSLNWTLPADGVAGDSYLRLRLTTDIAIATGAANTSVADGLANDGELEDYPLTIEPGGFTVSGYVYADNNVNGSRDNGDSGLAGVTVVLFDVNAGTCRSVQSGGEGFYRFLGVLPATYQLFEAAGEQYEAPEACPPTARDPYGYQSSTTNELNIDVVDSDVTEQNFADVATPSFQANQAKTIAPGSTVIYPHVFHTQASGTVDFSLASEASHPSLTGWNTVIYHDLNCDQSLDANEQPWSGSLVVSSNSDVCLLVKVLSPNTASTGASHQVTIQSEFVYGVGGILPIDQQTVNDLTQIAAQAAGKLLLEKRVQNISAGSAFVDVTEQTANQAQPGDTLRYILYYSNIDNGVLEDLVINDAVPPFTTLDNASVVCGTPLPDALVSCTPAINDDELSWTFTGLLTAGEKGQVSYEVTID